MLYSVQLFLRPMRRHFVFTMGFMKNWRFRVPFFEGCIDFFMLWKSPWARALQYHPCKHYVNWHPTLSCWMEAKVKFIEFSQAFFIKSFPMPICCHHGWRMEENLFRGFKRDEQGIIIIIIYKYSKWPHDVHIWAHIWNQNARHYNLSRHSTLSKHIKSQRKIN
jgi:hypothetical protein